MKYPCEIIRDLLPLYIDGVCSEESKAAIETHLTECEGCRQYYEAMKSTDGFKEKQNDNSEDMKMAESLKKIKGRINRKTRNIIICAAVAVILIAITFDVLFSMPIKEIDLSDISVSAEVYPISEIESGISVDNDAVRISFGDKDTDDFHRIVVPSMPEADIALSDGVMENNGYVTTVEWNSSHIIRKIDWSDSYGENGDTMYVKSFKTTILGSDAPDHTAKQLEFREINKIVYVDDNGKETVLWSR